MRDKIIKYIRSKVIMNPSANQTFKECSYDQCNDRYLVDSMVKTINFDKLTKRLGYKTGRRSADSFSITEDNVYLIEFKSGNQAANDLKVSKLISNVQDKINHSDVTLYEDIYKNSFDEKQNIPNLFFCLVVDSKEMGSDVMARELATLSSYESMNEYDKRMMDEVLPNLKIGCNHPDHFSDICIWYSELFDTYLSINRIISLEI